MASSHPVLGRVIEICIATPSHEETIRELLSFGIGPWKVYTFDSKDNISNATIGDQPAHFRLRVGFAQLTPDIAYEVIEPLNAESGDADIFSSWLKARNNLAGVHHIAYDCDDIPWKQRMQRFKDIGANVVQGGTWHGKKGTCQFAWFAKSKESVDVGEGSSDVGLTSTFFETIKFSSDWEDPDPDKTY